VRAPQRETAVSTPPKGPPPPSIFSSAPLGGAVRDALMGLKTAPLLDFFGSEAGRCAAPVCEKSFTEKKVYCRALFLPKKANLTEHPFKEYLCGLN
jgi:hypothetical protein